MKRTLGKSNIEVSALGMGCWAVGGPWTWAQPGHDPYPAGWGKTDDAEAVWAIHAALDAGINLFDTAANYGAGYSEIILGKGLKGRRNEAIIATKFGHIVNEEAKTVYGDDDQILANVRKDVENSLRRLQTDVIDIYQLHAGDYDPVKAVELRGVLETLVQEGKIRWYGWSTDLADRAQIFSEGEHCTSIQFRLNVIFDNIPMRELCARTNMAGINKDPLNKGILAGKFTTASTFPADDIRSMANFAEGELAERLQKVENLREVLTSGGRTMAQGALAYIWALDENMIPIPGFKNVQQASENARAMAFGPLTADQMRQIDDILNRGA
jgi:aryl-alcohol dehydrogenase-like predicted oxidoreductase